MFLLCLAVKHFSGNQERVESLYSTGFYPIFAQFLRRFFGFITFSFGDILYGFLFLLLVFTLLSFFYDLITRQLPRYNSAMLAQKVNRLFQIVLSIYLVFNVFWGLNYNKVPVGQSFKISVTDTSLTELKQLSVWLLEKVNKEKKLSLAERFEIHDFEFLQREAAISFKIFTEKFGMENFKHHSLKPTLYSWVANSSGYTGYYNPFTGEAQVNDANPFYEQPFVACHEMAHQLGYAKENEANFIGFLACIESRSHLFQYSAYKAMLSYALADLTVADSRYSRIIYDSLSAAVRQDMRYSSRVRSRYSKVLQPVVMGVYQKYLLSNEQPLGLLSYNEVTGLLIGYYKRSKYRSFY
jgi:hypothetical protein